MPVIRHVLGGLRSLLFKRVVDRELDDEVRQYIDNAAREHMRAGMTRDAAERVGWSAPV